MKTLSLALVLSLTATGAVLAKPPAKPTLGALAERAAGIKIPRHAPAEIRAAAEAWRAIAADVAKLDTATMAPADRLDARLLGELAEIRLFEIEEARVHELVPIQYFALGRTDQLLLRPCSAGADAIRGAIAELEALPAILQNARLNLKRPAKVWTENAIFQAGYARLLLAEELPAACLGDESLKPELLEATKPALDAVDGYREWLEKELLPRSDRAPSWPPAFLEKYQRVQEELPSELGTIDAMLAIADAEEKQLLDEMRELAKRIHPSGDLRTVWELMKDETPPWTEVRAMAQWYVDHTARWLQGDGARLLGIPDRFDYGVTPTPPMARRGLSFGGAYYGPTVADRISGYYVLTPLEARLDDAGRASRLRSYNPYWTHVISYHEWVGHNVQRAWAEQAPPRPVRALVQSAYLSQAWSFYLEKLFEDEGYYDTLPYVEALKTRMARRQMRMWRVQRITTKLRMAKGEMSFDQAVQAYVDKIGMEPTNAYIEVQRDSQFPWSPGREIIGEKVILQMRDAYFRRLGSHATLRGFHEDLLRQGELPLPAIQRILLGD